MKIFAGAPFSKRGPRKNVIQETEESPCFGGDGRESVTQRASLLFFLSSLCKIVGTVALCQEHDGPYRLARAVVSHYDGKKLSKLLKGCGETFLEKFPHMISYTSISFI